MLSSHIVLKSSSSTMTVVLEMTLELVSQNFLFFLHHTNTFNSSTPCFDTHINSSNSSNSRFEPQDSKPHIQDKFSTKK